MLLSDSFRISLNLIACYNIKVTKFMITFKEDNFIAIADVAFFSQIARVGEQNKFSYKNKELFITRLLVFSCCWF